VSGDGRLGAAAMPRWLVVELIRRNDVPGLFVVGLAVMLTFALERLVGMSPLVGGVLLGAIFANAGLLTARFVPGVAFAAKRLLRIGIVLLGLRLSVDEMRELGIKGVIAVVVVVLLTFFGVQFLARLMGLSEGLGLLVATGYSICGASAVAAMAPLSTADEEETAYAIGLVTLCGSLSILVLPFFGHLMNLSDLTFGAWVGAGVHDVGQVTATASAYSEASLVPATLVKLTRVILLAPMVFGVGVASRRRRVAQRAAADGGVEGVEGGEPDVHVPLVPLFVVGFLAAICLRATGWLSPEQLLRAKNAEQIFLTAGMFGLGASVQVSRLRRLGGRPMVLGLVSWVLVAGAAFVAAVAIT
jgi:uncharacterized integral membrane protein (TIGR00698 family)